MGEKLCKERDIPYTTKTTKAELIELLEDYDLYNPQTTVETRYYCPSHNVSICYGHKDIEVNITVKSMWDVWDSGDMPSGSSYNKYIEQFQKNGGWNESARAWAESLYNQDWLSAYGTDPSGLGMQTGSGLSPAEIAATTSQYGDVDAARTAICSDAMSFVGAIPYYWGGKSTNPDFAANHFGTTVKADYKGRTKKGLDCSGFVNWMLLRNFGHAYGWSTRDTTTNLKQINRSQLQPGDIGLENPAGSSTNHIGFFVGYNSAGQAMWCHCSGEAGGVTVIQRHVFDYIIRCFKLIAAGFGLPLSFFLQHLVVY